jgi:G3E family GTPase
MAHLAVLGRARDAGSGSQARDVGVRLIVIAGFLGSGKTSLLLAVARHLATASCRVAVIENEIGDVGIDGKYVADHGLLVQELFGGCVCCTLSVGLVDTLKNLHRSHRPDFVLLEPTGIAQPSDLATAVERFASWVDGIRVVTLLDAERYDMLMEVMGPLLEGQIANADIVTINKIDAVDDAVVARIMADTRTINGSALVVPISVRDRVNLDIVMEGLA